jgi:hypothetical protein
MYDYPEWDAMKGWNKALVTNAAVYQARLVVYSTCILLVS